MKNVPNRQPDLDGTSSISTGRKLSVKWCHLAVSSRHRNAIHLPPDLDLCLAHQRTIAWSDKDLEYLRPCKYPRKYMWDGQKLYFKYRIDAVYLDTSDTVPFGPIGTWRGLATNSCCQESLQLCHIDSLADAKEGYDILYAWEPQITDRCTYLDRSSIQKNGGNFGTFNEFHVWFVVSTPLKNISQLGWWHS